ncbi:hypothetical protein [Novosphingobium sp.]|uniref:hypothetical protein n=1 Tax=Novosphingobium sp. TaxID=1874826 RepID=UPI002FE3B57E
MDFRRAKPTKALSEHISLAAGGERRVSTSQLAALDPKLDAYFDGSIMADPVRVRKLVEEADPKVDKLIKMGTIFTGALRTFAGNLPHENGWLNSFKAHGLIHWQGKAQRSLVIRTESDFRFVRFGTECIRVVTTDGINHFDYTGDVVLVLEDGSWIVVEVKRDERDLHDPAYRAKLAATAEVLRRCGIGFEIVFRDEIFVDRHHRKNAELFASRAFCHIDPIHIDRLENLAMKGGVNSTFGAVAEALDPASNITGENLVRALTVRRRIKMDIARPITSETPVTIF